MIIEVFAKNQFEATHSWPDCNISEVNYLENEHRHIFHITSFKKVTHDNRDTEFIELKHRIQEYLESNFPFKQLGSMSCEMLAQELIEEFKLSRCIVSEDNENGAEVTA